MVGDAKKYEDDDKKQRERIDAKNGLENYAYSMKNAINDEKISSKLPAEDKQKILDAVEQQTKWLEHNQEGSKEEYEGHQKELEAVCNPIMQKVSLFKFIIIYMRFCCATSFRFVFSVTLEL